MQKSGKSPKNAPVAVPRGRGRPRAFDRGAALEQAMILFWRKGFEATSISDLTEAMGIGSPSLYAAFGSKEALYVEALRHYRDSFDPPAWQRLERTRPARAAIEGYLNWSAERLTGAASKRPSGCMVTLSSVSREAHPELHDLLLSERAVNFKRLKARLRDAVSDGEIPSSVDIASLARFIQSVQFGMSILARDGAKRRELRAVVELAMEGWDARIALAQRPQDDAVDPLTAKPRAKGTRGRG